MIDSSSGRVWRSALGACVLSLTGLGCASTPPCGAAKCDPAPAASTASPALAFIPDECDLVVRIDLARLRAALGAAAFAALLDLAAGEAGDGAPGPRVQLARSLLVNALGRADVAYVGLDLETDGGLLDQRVIVAEGNLADVLPEGVDARHVRATAGKLAHKFKLAESRASGSRCPSCVDTLFASGDRLRAFATPELARAISTHAAAHRGGRSFEPPSGALIGAELRVTPLPEPLAGRYPRIARLLEGLERVRAEASLAETGLVMRIEIAAKSGEAAQRARQFVDLYAEGARGSEKPVLSEVGRSLQVDRVDRFVFLQLTVPARAVLGAVSPNNGAVGGSPDDSDEMENSASPAIDAGSTRPSAQ